MKKNILFSLLFLAFVFSLLNFFPVFQSNISGERALVSLGTTTIDVEVVRTSAARTLGLSGRESLEGGMWFVFPKSDYYSFWMKDMKFPIDIIWISEGLEIVDIKENISPSSFPESFRPKTKAQFVLEVPAGFSKTHALTIGDTVSFQGK